MKRLLLTITAIILLTTPCLAQEQESKSPNKIVPDGRELPNKPQSDASPSLEETMAWLKSKLETDAGYTEEKGKSTTSYKVDSVEVDSCRLSFRLAANTQYEFRTISAANNSQSFSLSDIDPASIVVEPDGATSDLVLHTVGAAQKIRYKFMLRITTTITTVNEKDGMIDRALIPFRDKGMAERVAKAFAHAATLCKGKKEPF